LVVVSKHVGCNCGRRIGSVHEWTQTKTKDFPLFVGDSSFTDDSVLTVAVAEWILTGKDLVDTIHRYVDYYPGRGYGGMFWKWAAGRSREPYNSYGNGSAMRVSPVGSHSKRWTTCSRMQLKARS